MPTNRPCVRSVSPDRIFATADAKWEAIEEEICRVHQNGRPILIGTRSVTASERLSERLQARGLHVRVLNALRLLEEAQIIADAGDGGRITIATNMAGRGTDIVLGGNVEKQIELLEGTENLSETERSIKTNKLKVIFFHSNRFANFFYHVV